MSKLSFHSSRPDDWTSPKPFRDPCLRRQKFGPIRPMEEPGLLARLFHRY